MPDPFLVIAVTAALGLLAELGGLLRSVSRQTRKLAFGFSMVATGFASGLLLMAYPSAASGLIFLVSFYRFINQIRVVYGEMPEAKERPAALRSTFVLTALQAAVLLAWWANGRFGTADHVVGLTVLSAAGAAAAAVMLLSTVRTLRRARIRPADTHPTDGELPTVSVCIPARNETEDLPGCLESVIASDYPKLEILVLDDCSQDKTSEIIKGFAHAGVRFIQGEAPHKGWLAKNQAYKMLADNALGDYVLFCGVDVRLEPQTIRTAVATMQSRGKKMISILPVRSANGYAAALIQPLRYWWELSLPRRLFNRPPVLSTCWLIEKQSLSRYGGFDAVRRSILPEAYFARELVKHDGYSFLRSSDGLAVFSRKSQADQRATAIRMRYPQLRRRPENMLLLTAAELALVVAPIVLAVVGLVAHIGAAHYLALAACALLVLNHVLILGVTNPRVWALGLVSLPPAILTEIVLANESMWKYEFSEVIWKDRNVCIPVMRSIPRLPKA